MNKTTTQVKSDRIKTILSLYPQIIAGYFFGSRIKKKNTSKSDLDFGIICHDKAGVSSVELSSKIQSIITDKILDVVILDLKDDPLILIQVINGKLLYQKNSIKRIKTEMQILHIYEDNKILREISKYYLNKSFKEGIYAH